MTYRILETGGYLTTEIMQFRTGVLGHSACANETGFLDLSMDGLLTVYPGFNWDGASGPALDTDSIMDAALVHDAFYWLIERGYLPRSAREAADVEFFWCIRLFAEQAFCRSGGGFGARILHKLRLARSYWCFVAVRVLGGILLRNRKGTPAKIMKKFALMLALVVVAGCSRYPMPSEMAKRLSVELTPEQRDCVAVESAKASAFALACGKNNEGECNNDTIYARALEEKYACLEK